jgi:CRISPR/Cas system-associated exonuclease Cas4 (RecB family)
VEIMARHILTDIDAAVVATSDTSFRHHMGASVIGDECHRRVWYSFRWVRRHPYSGRMLRLFQRGHEEEVRFVDFLRRAGWKVTEVDPATGEQFRFTAIEGHFGGSMDGIGTPPAGKLYSDLGPLVLEFKTAAKKPWTRVANDGVAKAQPKHYAQMQLYMRARELDNALYLSVCKDNDELYAEIVPYRPDVAAGYLAQAQLLISSQDAPPGISSDPTFWKCKFCDYHAVCHGDEAPAQNCRSCKHAVPAEGSVWHCERHDVEIPRDRLAVAHPCWESLL